MSGVWRGPPSSQESDVHLHFCQLVLCLSDILSDVMWVACGWDEGGVVDDDNVFGCHQSLGERPGSRLLLVE
jgi:hypothetical protein